ncbi:MAG: DNA repair protein RecO [Nitrospirota bacterium]
MLHRTEGIVLKTTPYGEADLIVTYLTKDYGILKTFAKSPRKIKSRFGSSLEPFTHSKISFWGREDAALPRLTQSDIINSFHLPRNTVKCYLKISELIELILNFVPEREVNKRAFFLLMDILLSFEEDCETEMLMLYYRVRLLELAGYLPKLDSCGRCGKKGDAFFVSHGTVLCENCSRGYETSFRISAGIINLYSHLLNWSRSNIKRIKPTKELISEFSGLIDEHVRYIIERNLKTKAFKIS